MVSFFFLLIFFLQKIPNFFAQALKLSLVLIIVHPHFNATYNTSTRYQPSNNKSQCGLQTPKKELSDQQNISRMRLPATRSPVLSFAEPQNISRPSLVQVAYTHTHTHRPHSSLSTSSRKTKKKPALKWEQYEKHKIVEKPLRPPSSSTNLTNYRLTQTRLDLVIQGLCVPYMVGLARLQHWNCPELNNPAVHFYSSAQPTSATAGHRATLARLNA